jgi:hypothetical protein
MAKYQYALEKGQPKRLEIVTRFNFTGATIKLDGNEILEIPNGEAFRQGVVVSLPDGSQVNVMLKTSFMGTSLLVSRNGQPLPGSGADPMTKLKAAYGIIYLLAGANLLGGILAVLMENSFLSDLGLGWTTIITGLIYLVLGFFTQRKSKAALIIAISLYILDAVLMLYFSIVEAGSFPTGGLIIRVLFVIAMISGVKAIDEMKAEQKSAVPTIQ